MQAVKAVLQAHAVLPCQLTRSHGLQQPDAAWSLQPPLPASLAFDQGITSCSHPPAPAAPPAKLPCNIASSGIDACYRSATFFAT